MAAIHDLIKQVPDEALRFLLEEEVKKLTKKKKFGLVFEDHLDENVFLYDMPIKKGATVAKKKEGSSVLYTVVGLNQNIANCVKKGTNEIEKIDVSELVVTAQFGEAIYPYLQPIDSICNAPDSDLWHTLIEADNYHALQLLEYLYAGKVDCIYIDPPYNTGATDWKYNNDYVDGADSYRHSKWLSMMQKRLKIAKKLLTNDGILIVAIDDYEVSHLMLLLEECFSNYDLNPVIVNHHPQGGASGNISRTHEYAIFVTPRGQELIKGNIIENVDEKWSLTRGGTDIRNLRKGRPNSFYAIYVENNTNKVIGVGPHLDVDTYYDPQLAPEGCTAFYPVGKDGTERVWRYERESMVQHINNGDIICANGKTLNVVKHKEKKYEPVFSVWTDGRYNAGTFGTNIVYDIFSSQKRFPYPKSLYTVLDCIRFSIQNKPNAIVLDFFAGSGTTLQAINILNAEDNGKRQCVLVTNNEVLQEEEKALLKKGFKPGDEEWNNLGIARYVTWPRTKNTILGLQENKQRLNGEYLTDNIITVEKQRRFVQIDFLMESTKLNLSSKKAILGFLGNGIIPQKYVTNDAAFIANDKCNAAILFDDRYVKEWLEALVDQFHITTFFIITKDKKLFLSIKEDIQDLLGNYVASEKQTLPMANGFRANAAFFKLSFLDKTTVALGRKLPEMMPILWLKSGAHGPCPTVINEEKGYFISDNNNFAILIDESRFSFFYQEILNKPTIDTIFFVTDSESGYREMLAKFPGKNTYQLFRDYLEHFTIHTGR